MTMAHRATADIRRDGFRQLRNYVELCLTLSGQSRYRTFFEYALQKLEKADSLYYSLIQCLLDTVEENRICTAGVNFGLGGLVYGAAAIKERREEGDDREAAWLHVANAADPRLSVAVERVEQQNGYVWILYVCSAAEVGTVVALAKKYPHIAFLMLLSPECLQETTIELLQKRPNIVTLLLLQKPELSQHTIETAQNLRTKKLFYGFVTLLDEADCAAALQPDWLDTLAKNALFCVYARREGVCEETSEQLRKAVIRHRVELNAPLLLLDWDSDMKVLNHAIGADTVIGTITTEADAFPLQIKQ